MASKVTRVPPPDEVTAGQAPAAAPAPAPEQVQAQPIQFIPDAPAVAADPEPEPEAKAEPVETVSAQVAPKTSCQKCGSAACGFAGGKARCNQCGHQWNP